MEFVLSSLDHILEKNVKWAAEISEKNPEFFSDLSKLQNPDYLWIGCSDSRVPANQIVDLPPGTVFVHRNIANVVVHSDLNCLSVIQFAVEVLKIKHIIVCGHYGCGGIKASMEDDYHGLIDNWLNHIRDVSRFNAEALEGLDECEKLDKLCELNVIEQARNVSNTTIVQNAWRKGWDLSIHGWIYDLNNGVLKDLGVCITESNQSEEEQE